MKRIQALLLSVFLIISSVAIVPGAQAKPLKACGKVGYEGGRVLQNIVCKDGSPNSSATKQLKSNTPNMMKLKKNATFRQIYAAICKDWGDVTGPDLMVTYDYLSALHDWKSRQHQAVYQNYPDCDQY